jgi:hypothetical protein
MAITVNAFACADDVLIAWKPAAWNDNWAGFCVEKRDERTHDIAPLKNRIPPKAGEAAVGQDGISSADSPIRRCIWIDHSVGLTDQVSYRVIPMIETAAGFDRDDANASVWTQPSLVTGRTADGISAFFNRGTLMSQVVSRLVGGDASAQSLRTFLAKLKDPGYVGRRYLSGDLRSELLGFLADADRRGNSIYAAIYEMNDAELVQGLKPFGARGHLLMGNGGATENWVMTDLHDAGFELFHRDLSKSGKSSPSVHNKFVVEVTPAGKALRALTGSTNWTVTGLCTQLNNLVILDRPDVADRFLKQWHALVAARDDMPADLVDANTQPKDDGDVTLYFAATRGQAEFAPVIEAIRNAQQGVMALMFTPGQSPLLTEILARAAENKIYVRSVVSSVEAQADDGSDAPGKIVRVSSQVIKSGAAAKGFHNDVLVPSGVRENNRPSWAETEFNVAEMRAEHLMAIVHSKTIVIDPFSDDCVVVTGSHNFSPSASQKNDENLVIIRGNKALAQAYAVHINGVYDGYSWRAYLGGGGNAGHIYAPLDGWKAGGARHQELGFWMGGNGTV